MKENLTSTPHIAWCADQLAPQKVQRVEPLRVEASHRHFYRVHTGTKTAVLMVSPPELEDNRRFVALAEVFRRHGIPVPGLLATHFDAGWFLMDDLGERHLEDAYAGAESDEALTSAVQTLAALGRVSAPEIEPYTPDRFTMELGIFTEWLADKTLGIDIHAAAEFDLLIDATQAQPQACVHRDYHCRNLLWHDHQLGIVDFQDALHGPCLYDIASLLRDCYYTFEEDEIDRWLGVFVAATPALAASSANEIKRWFDFTAIQRQLKAIGIFARLHLRDGKSSHLGHIMPVTERLIALLATYPELKHLKKQLESCKKSMIKLAGTPQWRKLASTAELP